MAMGVEPAGPTHLETVATTTETSDVTEFRGTEEPGTEPSDPNHLELVARMEGGHAGEVSAAKEHGMERIDPDHPETAVKTDVHDGEIGELSATKETGAEPADPAHPEMVAKTENEQVGETVELSAAKESVVEPVLPRTAAAKGKVKKPALDRQLTRKGSMQFTRRRGPPSRNATMEQLQIQEMDVDEADEKIAIEQAKESETEQEKLERMMRTALVEAINSGDFYALEQTLFEFKEKGTPDPQNLRQRAERDMAVLVTKRDLEGAMESEDMKTLRLAIQAARGLKNSRRLFQLVVEAQKLYNRLEKVESLRHAVLNLDQRTIAELKSFSHPPPAISTVMRGVLLLLGSDKQEMQDWRRITILLGKTGPMSLKRRVLEFRVKDIDPQVVEECESILSEFSLGDVQALNTGAVTFYLWAKGMTAEYHKTSK